MSKRLYISVCFLFFPPGVIRQITHCALDNDNFSKYNLFFCQVMACNENNFLGFALPLDST